MTSKKPAAKSVLVMTTEPVSEPLRGLDACIAMHTALRKCCDGPATSAAYNLIHLFGGLSYDEAVCPWRHYGEEVAALVNRGVACDRACFEAADMLTHSWHEKVSKPRKDAGQRIDDNAVTACHALKASFRLFDDADWRGMASYLDES